MPYKVIAHVDHDGRAIPAHSVVSDALAAEIDKDHPHALTRIAHDDDICPHVLDGCDHESHPWNAPASPAPVAARSARSLSTSASAESEAV